jgi:putative Mg2+ transporter-C (MgtC) family protein
MFIEWELLLDYLFRLMAASLAGAVIGLERELRGKPAGLRTMVLITMGSALYMVGSDLIARMSGGPVDPGRVAAQIVTGVGFLGAGAILVARQKVVGLTTAAIIWMAAAIGLVMGYGALLLGGLVSVIVLLFLVSLTQIEKRWLHPWARRHGFNNVPDHAKRVNDYPPERQ